jgi:hypothetical protein
LAVELNIDLRFNPNHLPAGPGGGQFTSDGGGEINRLVEEKYARLKEKPEGK